jgi:superfamily II DNA or RNA helicase
MPLFQHQIDFLKQNPDKSALIHSCGTGKTRTAIEWAKKYKRWVLIICPKSLKTNWRRECEEWGLNTYHVLTKEEFRKSWEYLSAFEQVIVDEVHNGFLTPHFKSQMSKALRAYLKKHDVRRVLLLSATVYSSSPWNIYSLAYYLGNKWDYKKFDTMFFNYVRMGFKYVPVAKKGCEKKLAEMTKKIASVVSLEECVDVPEQTFENEYFELTKEQEKLIEANYDPLPIVRFTSADEISNGVLKGNEFRKDIMDIPSLKNERIFDLCQENKKIIVVCRYNLQIDFLDNYLKSIGKPIFIIRGEVKDRDAVVQEAEKSAEAIVLIQSSCSVGYELPSFSIMVFASLDFSYTHFVQICGRILRINRLHKNVYISLITGETGQAVADAIAHKKDFDINLYEKQNNTKEQMEKFLL